MRNAIALILLWSTGLQASELASLQKSWDATTSYKADFVQTVKSKGTGMDEEPSKGSVWVGKPDRLRWEDKTTGVTQILRGKEYWDITENRRRKSRTVNYSPDVSASRGSLAVLSGGKFEDFYKVKVVSNTPKQAVLSLKPKTSSNETLIAKIDKNGYVLRSLTTDSPDSTVTVEFQNIQRNPVFTDEEAKKLFTYEKQENDVFQERKG